MRTERERQLEIIMENIKMMSEQALANGKSDIMRKALGNILRQTKDAFGIDDYID